LVGIEGVGESKRQHLHFGVAQAEVDRIGLDLHDVPYEGVGRGRVQAAILPQVGGQVEWGAVDVPGGLHHQAADRALGARAAGQEVEGPDHVVLVGAGRVAVAGVDGGGRVD